jgi:hypothetical protein
MIGERAQNDLSAGHLQSGHLSPQTNFAPAKGSAKAAHPKG